MELLETFIRLQQGMVVLAELLVMQVTPETRVVQERQVMPEQPVLTATAQPTAIQQPRLILE
jgi:hypothetical protein